MELIKLLISCPWAENDLLFFLKASCIGTALEKGEHSFKEQSDEMRSCFFSNFLKRFSYFLFSLAASDWVGLFCFSGIGSIFKSQSWPVEGRAEIEGTLQQKPPLLTHRKRSLCQVLQSWVVLQAQYGLKLCPRCMPSSNFLTFQKNISLIFPNGRGCWASLSLQSRDVQGPAVYLFSALELYYLSVHLMALSIAPQLFIPEVYTFSTFISSFFSHLNGCITLNCFNLPPSFIDCATPSDFLGQKGWSCQMYFSLLEMLNEASRHHIGLPSGEIPS